MTANIKNFLFGLTFVFGLFTLGTGILLTAAALEHGHLLLISLGAGLVVGACAGLEFILRAQGNASAATTRESVALFDHGPTVIEVLLLQGIIILIFAGILDGGVRLRACLYCYVAYVPGAVILLVRRAPALTKVDLLYIKWGWVPIITFGVPILVRLSKGLI